MAIIQDANKTEDFLREIEEKLKTIPKIGNALSNVPVLISLVRDFAKGDYKVPPIGTIVAIVAALLYLLTPIDLIPDMIPGVGYLDDAAVIGFCVKQISHDLDLYKLWRDQ